MVMQSKNNSLRKFFGLLQQKIVHKIVNDHKFYQNYLKDALVQVSFALMVSPSSS